ncbi:MAG: riboflavin synthase [Myxococcales bacterium]
MFTGLVEDVGTVAAVAEVAGGGARVAIDTRLPEADLALGASVAVDGACLTVVRLEPAGGGVRRFFADASIETLQRTTLGERRPGDKVNLERPLALGERLGGHLVLGHADGVGRIVARDEAGAGVRFRVAVPAALSRLVVEKGSIALDGISLTVNALQGDEIGLLLIPESLRATTWGSKRAGAAVNVEADILGKHVARLLGKGG